MFTGLKLILLYTDTEKEGAKNFIKIRSTVPPAQRYYFPETSNWELGWNTPDNIRDEFYGRNFVRILFILSLILYSSKETYFLVLF